MKETIKHIVQKGETLESIAHDYGISVTELHSFHNQNATHIHQLILSFMGVSEGAELLMKQEKPPKPPLQIKEISEEDKGREEKRQTKKEALQYGKEEYFIVDGAKCLCDKGTIPATLKVNSHTKSIFNSKGNDKWAATLEDVQFKEGNSCFGSCAVKNNNPCTFSPAGLWQKPFEKTKVMDKKVLVESSFLMCVIGGKISVQHHGQTILLGSNNIQKSDAELLNQVMSGINFEEFQAEYDDNQYYL
ncbi:PAAR-like protein [Chryseobacterium sp. c4a]|uniref:PAAR-like protein n=1 Tax=Chryseobacterium sp. c4a TaxID=1573582 RepID=UPI001359F980|nr:PAAR-like protein [Chryseobacterium sp. c4a]